MQIRPNISPALFWARSTKLYHKESGQGGTGEPGSQGARALCQEQPAVSTNCVRGMGVTLYLLGHTGSIFS